MLARSQWAARVVSVVVASCVACGLSVWGVSAATAMPTATDIADPSPTVVPAPTVTATSTPTPTATPTEVAEPSPSDAPVPEQTPEPTASVSGPIAIPDPPEETLADDSSEGDALVAAAAVNPANTARVAWVGGPDLRPSDDTLLLTLQAALDAAPPNGEVGVIDGELIFTNGTTLNAPRPVTVYSVGGTQINAMWSVGGDFAASAVSFQPTANRATVLVRPGTVGATIENVTVRNALGQAGAAGVGLAGTDAVVVDALTADLGGATNTTGVLVGTGTNAVVVDADVTGAANAVSSSAGSGALTVTGGALTANTSAISASGFGGDLTVTGAGLQNSAAVPSNNASAVDARGAASVTLTDTSPDGT